MAERKINVYDASFFRMQAMLENTLRIQCEILSGLTSRPFQEIWDQVLSDVLRDTSELIKMHSDLGGDLNQN